MATHTSEKEVKSSAICLIDISLEEGKTYRRHEDEFPGRMLDGCVDRVSGKKILKTLWNTGAREIVHARADSSGV